MALDDFYCRKLFEKSEMYRYIHELPGPESIKTLTQGERDNVPEVTHNQYLFRRRYPCIMGNSLMHIGAVAAAF